MVIRKQFKFEGAHIVRDCSSEYCKKSIHGHSYLVEVLIESKDLDNGCMVMDFGLLKPHIKDFIESFDHAWSYWELEDPSYKAFVQENSKRWVEMPISPSAEGYSLLMFYVIDKIIKNTRFTNRETDPTLKSVRVHETATGYAECFRDDLPLVNFELEDIKFSPAIVSDWTNKLMFYSLRSGTKFQNPQVKLLYNHKNK